jgi:hypothetical protein
MNADPVIEYDEDVEHAPAEEQPDYFLIDSEDRAAWAVDKILSYEETRQRIKAQADRMMADLDKREASFRQRFEPELARWAEERMPEHRRYVDTLAGRIGFRLAKGGPRITDREAATEWAKAYLPAAVSSEMVLKLDARIIKEHVEKHGELPPGVDFVPDEDRLYVKAPRG